MPTLPCDARFMKYDNASGTWIGSTYSTVSGWANGSITLDPAKARSCAPAPTPPSSLPSRVVRTCPPCQSPFRLTAVTCSARRPMRSARTRTSWGLTRTIWLLEVEFGALWLGNVHPERRGLGIHGASGLASDGSGRRPGRGRLDWPFGSPPDKPDAPCPSAKTVRATPIGILTCR